MYKNFFGLREHPFRINPDPRYLFPTPQTEDAWDQLRYGIAGRAGLCVLTGEVGTGKTTLINRLLEWLRQQHAHTAFVFNSHLEPRHLMDFLLADLGVPVEARNNSHSLMQLRRWLLEQYRANQIAVLIVDEAQGLSLDLLEEVRLLLNVETPSEKLLQVVLVGQPELEDTLKRRELRQLRQRIAICCRTVPLTYEQTHQYIRARLRMAGSNGNAIFTSEAVDFIHFFSQGIPRVINLLCEHSLINAYVDNLRPIPASIVEEVAHELQCDDVQRYTPLSRGENFQPAHSISTNLVSANAPAPPVSAAETSAAVLPIAAAKPTIVPNYERTSENPKASEIFGDPIQGETEPDLESTGFTSEDAFQLLAAWALKSQTVSSPTALQVINHKINLEDSQTSELSLAYPGGISADQSFSDVKEFERFGLLHVKLFRKWPAWLNRRSVSWETHWPAIISSPKLASVRSTGVAWLRWTMNRGEQVCHRSSTWLLGKSPMASPRMALPLIRWLQQPWG
jgi:general secretion pathway protein A